jgi:hypothetical protein
MEKAYDIPFEKPLHRLREFVVIKPFTVGVEGGVSYRTFNGEIISNRYFMSEGREWFASTHRLETAVSASFIAEHPQYFSEREYVEDVIDKAWKKDCKIDKFVLNVPFDTISNYYSVSADYCGFLRILISKAGIKEIIKQVKKQIRGEK